MRAFILALVLTLAAAPALALVMLAALLLVPVDDAPHPTFKQQPLPKIAPAPEFS